jgi:hypothetical protein
VDDSPSRSEETLIAAADQRDLPEAVAAPMRRRLARFCPCRDGRRRDGRQSRVVSAPINNSAVAGLVASGTSCTLHTRISP